MQKHNCKLIIYPNDILKKSCEKISDFKDLDKLIDLMKEEMLHHNGIGLSCNQIGISKKLFIMKDNKGNIIEFINPKILEVNGKLKLNEGCLSSPGIFLPITRSETVLIEYKDKNGELKKSYAEGIEARCIQHEIEHLEGKFYFEQVNRQMRKAAISQLKKNLK